MATQAGQGGQTQVTGPASGQCLHEQRLVRDKAHNSDLVVEQLWDRRGREHVSLRHERKKKRKEKLYRKTLSNCAHTLIAVSKEPARMWSTGSWELLHHICAGLMPLVGGTKKPSSAPPAPPDGIS